MERAFLRLGVDAACLGLRQSFNTRSWAARLGAASPSEAKRSTEAAEGCLFMGLECIAAAVLGLAARIIPPSFLYRLVLAGRMALRAAQGGKVFEAVLRRSERVVEITGLDKPTGVKEGRVVFFDHLGRPSSERPTSDWKNLAAFFTLIQRDSQNHADLATEAFWAGYVDPAVDNNEISAHGANLLLGLRSCKTRQISAMRGMACMILLARSENPYADQSRRHFLRFQYLIHSFYRSYHPACPPDSAAYFHGLVAYFLERGYIVEAEFYHLLRIIPKADLAPLDRFLAALRKKQKHHAPPTTMAADKPHPRALRLGAAWAKMSGLKCSVTQDQDIELPEPLDRPHYVASLKSEIASQLKTRKSHGYAAGMLNEIYLAGAISLSQYEDLRGLLSDEARQMDLAFLLKSLSLGRPEPDYRTPFFNSAHAGFYDLAYRIDRCFKGRDEADPLEAAYWFGNAMTCYSKRSISRPELRFLTHMMPRWDGCAQVYAYLDALEESAASGNPFF